MQEINLYDLIRYYIKNWRILLSAAFVGAILGLIYTGFIQTPLYKSEATILVVGANSTQNTTVNNNYTGVFKSRRTLDSVISKQSYKGSYEQLLSRTTATNEKSSDIIKVSISDPEANKGRELLTVALATFKKEADALYGVDNIKIVDAASTPTKPYNVSVVNQVSLAIAALLLTTIVLLFFIYDYSISEGAPVSKLILINHPKKESGSVKNRSAKSDRSNPATKKSLAGSKTVKKK